MTDTPARRHTPAKVIARCTSYDRGPGPCPDCVDGWVTLDPTTTAIPAFGFDSADLALIAETIPNAPSTTGFKWLDEHTKLCGQCSDSFIAFDLAKTICRFCSADNQTDAWFDAMETLHDQ